MKICGHLGHKLNTSNGNVETVTARARLERINLREFKELPHGKKFW